MTQQNVSIQSSHLAHMFFVTIHINDLPGCYGNTVTRDKRSLSYLIFVVLGQQELILLGHEIFVAMKSSQIFTKSPPPPCSTLNDRSLIFNIALGQAGALIKFF